MLERTEKNKLSLTLDLAVALLPAIAWSVYLFGARALVLELLCGLFAAGFEFPAQMLILHQPPNRCFSGFALLSGVIASLFLPVSAPLWIAPIVGLLTAALRLPRGYFCHRPVNAAVGSALGCYLMFPSFAKRFTMPFAYFPAYLIQIPDAMVEKYACRTPIDLLMSERIYEDGIFAQLYGFAAGGLAATAALALAFGFGFLAVRRTVKINTTGMYLLTLVVMSAALSPEKVQMINYAWVYILSGGVPLIAFIAVNDYSTSPMRQYGTACALFGVLAALLTVLFRALHFGLPGDLAAVLVANLLAPWLEKITEPKRYYQPNRKHDVKKVKSNE